uniref:Uncharacterized protein LOC113796462 n=2 Tax=Dermatophagoides pteronyssinus TaxID=6956 RepID=A0A6P6YB83_DERPT|nr:uncharacterized protein LOC113796462 [Dermatophagoides pteronyssinus]
MLFNAILVRLMFVYFKNAIRLSLQRTRLQLEQNAITDAECICTIRLLGQISMKFHSKAGYLALIFFLDWTFYLIHTLLTIHQENENIPAKIFNKKLFSLIKQELIKNCDIYCKNREPKIRTKKVAKSSINKEIIYYLNIIIRSSDLKMKYIPTGSLSEISNMLYACQITYENTVQQRKNQNVNNPKCFRLNEKIKKWQDDLNILNNYDQSQRPSREIIRICKRYHIHSKDNVEVTNLKVRLNDQITIKQTEIKRYKSRTEFNKQNHQFEFNRKQFYRSLESNVKNTISENIDLDSTKKYWEEIWCGHDSTTGNYENLINTIQPINLQIDTSNEKIANIVKNNIRFLSNWKAPGKDFIYNFWIKKLTSLHNVLINAICEAIKNPNENIDESLYEGITYLIPKKEISSEPKDLRPITCLSNIYKLTSKTFTTLFNEICEINDIISSNQMGTRNRCQGAKEQSLINKTIYTSHHNLSTCWIDVTKAFDSIDHKYLMKCIEKLELPDFMASFIKRMLEMQQVSLRCLNNDIGTVKIGNGIMQGDSLSPKLFVFALEPLSRLLNNTFEKVPCDEDSLLERNHLCFIDDIKLIAFDTNTLESMCELTNQSLLTMGLKINQDKSNTNVTSDRVVGGFLNETNTYKYLGIVENSESQIVEQNKFILKDKIKKRIEELCQTRLNGVNMFRAINEYAISSINYYVGVVDFSPEEFKDIDKEIRQILNKYKIIWKSANNDRLYLKRNELGRGLINVEEHAELMMFKLLNHLESRPETRVVVENERTNIAPLGYIREYIQAKYKFNDLNFDFKDIQMEQYMMRLEKIKEKKLHGILFSDDDHHIDIRQSSIWLSHGNISAREEGALCALQDRNLFYDQRRCETCNKVKKTVDHIATHCGKYVKFEYTSRHDRVLKCCHLHIMKKFGFTKNNKIGLHKTEKSMCNKDGSIIIKSDTPIYTHNQTITENKPDIYVQDNNNRNIDIIEIGITNKNIISTTEITKHHKYDLLANSLKVMYPTFTTSNIPVVLSWDGLVTKYNNKYMQMLGINKKIMAFIQYSSLKSTFEIVCKDRGVRGTLWDVDEGLPGLEEEPDYIDPDLL